jgi:hypothetical protein
VCLACIFCFLLQRRNGKSEKEELKREVVVDKKDDLKLKKRRAKKDGGKVKD